MPGITPQAQTQFRACGFYNEEGSNLQVKTNATRIESL